MSGLLGDFQYSIAQEDIDFVTDIVQSTTPGENYQNVAIYIENTRFVEDADSFVALGTSAFKLAILTKNNYASVVNGLLLSWLTDFFANGTSSKVYLITFITDLTSNTDWDETAVGLLGQAYDLTKTLAYWKLPLVATDADVTPVLLPEVAVDFCKINNTDLKLLSAAVPLPYTTATPATFDSDTLYKAIADEGLEAWFCAHQDATRHGGLFSLGLALSLVNMSGTPVGNSIDYVRTNLITSSGLNGEALNTSLQGVLKAANIQYFKPVGNGTGFVAAVGQKTLKGDYILANWIVNYCNYVNKVLIAEMTTVMNFMRNAQNYKKILDRMWMTVNRFVTSGRLASLKVTAPSFGSLPESAGDEYIVPNAWSANFIDNVRKVRVYGTLFIQG